MKRKTTKQKQLEGTARQDRTRKPKVVKLTEIPPPQSFLPKAAHGIYNRLCEHLKENDCLQKIDTFLVSSCAHSFHLYAYYARAVKLAGAIQKFKTGAKNVSAEYTVMIKERDQIEKYSKLFGLDPASRQKIIAFTETQPKEKEDAVRKFLTGNG